MIEVSKTYKVRITEGDLMAMFHQVLMAKEGKMGPIKNGVILFKSPDLPVEFEVEIDKDSRGYRRYTPLHKLASR